MLTEIDVERLMTDRRKINAARIFRRIKDILGRGNNVEIRLRSNGQIAVYEVKKKVEDFSI